MNFKKIHLISCDSPESNIIKSAIISNRLLAKPASGSKMLGDLGAQDRNVFNIHEDPSTKSTKQVAAEVGFMIDIVEAEQADLIVVIGGDGMMIHAIHQYMHLNVPFYGVKSSKNIGFMLNNFNADEFVDNIATARVTKLYPLKMKATDCEGNIFTELAINEVSIFRSTNQAAKFKILIDDIERMQMAADGALVATPAGSSAYNLSAGGSIVPLNSKVLSLTAICPFRPRRWKGALLPFGANIKFVIQEQDKRPVNAVADFHEFKNIESVEITSTDEYVIKLLFDLSHTFEDRVIKEQFSF